MRRFLPAGLFFFLLGTYHLNGDFLPIRDAAANLHSAVALVTRGTFSFTPITTPEAYDWKLRTDKEWEPVSIPHWDVLIRNRKASELHDRGDLVLDLPPYYLAPTRQAGTTVSIYGPGTALMIAPVFGMIQNADVDLQRRPWIVWYAGKMVAACLVAASAVFIFWTCAGFTTPERSAIVALAYGLGTCVWSASSQALWQQAPTVFFTSLGILLLSRRERGRAWLAGAGAALGAAVVCRPTAGLVLIALGVYLAAIDRKTLLPFVLGALGPGILLAAYNGWYFGSPFSFGQGETGAVARIKTGSPGLWQTPLWVGLPGLLLSPARGLLVFSPFLAFALWGAFAAWKSPAHKLLRPVSAAFFALLLLSSIWFDWWGGYSFGYRLIADLMPLLILLVLPVLDRIYSDKRLLASGAVLLVFSVMVQFVGAFAYDIGGWDGRTVYEVRSPGRPTVRMEDLEEARTLAWTRTGSTGQVIVLDIDTQEHRGRLWSIADSPIPYYVSRFARARKAKRGMMASTLEPSLP